MKASLLFAITPLLSVTACPGSSSTFHAKCEIGVKFSNTCEEVQSEIIGRMQSPSWSDPHNGGTYTLLSSNTTYVSGERLTGDKKYTDKFDFLFSASGASCKVEACSESQIFSITDYSTNYCNLHDLYCASADGCPTMGKELSYTETFSSCSQHDDICIVNRLHTTEECSADLEKLEVDFTQLQSALSKAAIDCADGYTYTCQDDQDQILLLIYATIPGDLSKATADCGGADCTDAFKIIHTDLYTDVNDIAEVFFDCGSNPTRCQEDFITLANDIAKTQQDIANAVTACSS